MKKRLISLLLISVMIMLCFAGCAEKTGEEVKEKIGEEASADAITISMYLMSEVAVSERQEALMEEKVNEITESKYKVHVDLVYNAPDVYYKVLEENLAKMNEHYSSGSAGKTQQEPVYIDENGLPVVYYPTIEDFDVDIFYFGGYDKYVQYKEAGYLTTVDEQEGSTKALLSVINKTLIEQFKAVNGGYSAIPTNRTIGEYTYILLNKDVLDVTKYSKNDITSLVSESCQDLLNMVNTEEELQGYVPLYSTEGELNTLGVKYFDTDATGLLTNSFSVLGGTYSNAWTLGAQNSYPIMDSVLASVDNGNLTAKEQVEILKEYSFKGYYGTEDDASKPFAVGYVKGGPEVVAQYGDEYEIVVAEAPTLEHEDLYESMFGISNYTNSVSASTEILTLLNSDEEFRNLILYGVEGENYTWVDSDVLDSNGNPYRVVSRQMKDPEKLYLMDAVKTGNVGLVYPAKGENPLASEYLIQQNNDLKVDYILGFSFFDGVNAELIDTESFDALLALCEASDAVYAKIEAAKNETELDAALAELEALTQTENYAKVMNTGDGAKSPLSYYMTWLIEKGLNVAPEAAE